ncbi:Os10g0155900 [Oryza sativa Japonica Group]|uniref:Os10g0155900 protein n=1 Tax=Oryza sativa subsp. japonica TaxID=39947 RepID=A0A0P0XS57_ORYSJ|nr:Os10g0155900 [Oryza sativa Japonica Group]
MEFVGANSLRDFIAGCPFSEGETRALMRRLLAGVRAMHRAGMAHRDIKPGNILVGPGFARFATSGWPRRRRRRTSRTWNSLAFGGLRWLSPAGREVLAGLLAFDGDKRMTAEAALEHRWFTEEADSPAVLSCLAAIAS